MVSLQRDSVYSQNIVQAAIFQYAYDKLERKTKAALCGKILPEIISLVKGRSRVSFANSVAHGLLARKELHAHVDATNVEIAVEEQRQVLEDEGEQNGRRLPHETKTAIINFGVASLRHIRICELNLGRAYVIEIPNGYGNVCMGPEAQNLTHTTPNETNTSAKPPQDHRGGAGGP